MARFRAREPLRHWHAVTSFPSAFLFDTPSLGNPHPAGLRLSEAFKPDESQKKA